MNHRLDENGDLLQMYKEFLSEDMIIFNTLIDDIKYWEKRCAIRSITDNKEMLNFCKDYLNQLRQELEQEKGRIREYYGDKAFLHIFSGTKKGTRKSWWKTEAPDQVSTNPEQDNLGS